MPEEENEVMQEEGKKRIRRTPEQIAESIDAEIEDLKESIQKVDEKKKAAIAEFDRKIESYKDKIKKLEGNYSEPYIVENQRRQHKILC